MINQELPPVALFNFIPTNYDMFCYNYTQSEDNMINEKTALAFDNFVCDGFVQPNLVWSATTPEHLNGVGGSSITSNFWVGKPEDVKKFANQLAKFYKDFCKDEENFDEELEDYESISVAYWEKDGIAMCAELSTSDQIFEVLPDSFFDDANEKLKHVLFDGNDNHPGLVLKNKGVLLSVSDRIKLASFMRREATIWVVKEEYRDEYLPDFTQ